jgi:putative tryptophan/tyrosine transport system substrate-binding protein
MTLLGAAAAAWPLAARAQQSGPVRRVGVLMNGAATEAGPQSYVAAFLQALQQLGWTEGQNLRVDVRLPVMPPSRASTRRFKVLNR